MDYKKALFKEQADENSKQWYNIIVAKKDWETSPKADAIKKVIAAYHTDDVKKVIEETSERFGSTSLVIRNREVGEKIPPLAFV